MSWEEVTDEEGRVYYYNSETQETTWDRPDELDTPVDRALRNTQWQRFVSDEGKPYYYNAETQLTTWELPEEVRSALVAAQVDVPELHETAPEETEATPEKDETAVVGDSLIDVDAVIREHRHTEEPVEASESKEKFVEMLEEHEVGSSWSFNKVMETFIGDPRYWAVSDALMRKQIFESYLINKTEREMKETTNSREAFKAEFLKVLARHSDIKYYTRWKTCQKLIIDEPIFSLGSDRLKRHIFEDYVRELRSNNDEEAKSAKKLAIQEIDRLLREKYSLSVSDRWEDTLAKLEADPEVKQLDLTRLDILTVYESIMREYEQEFQRKVEREKKLNYRSDRQARDAFKELLRELSESGKLVFDSKTQWHQLVAFSQDPRFVNLCGRSGSSAIDLYWDLIDHENQVLRAKKDIVDQTIIDYNLTHEPFDIAQSSYDKFVEACHFSAVAREYSERDLKYIYDMLQKEHTESESRKRKLDQKQDEAKKRKLASAPVKRLQTLGYGSLPTL